MKDAVKDICDRIVATNPDMSTQEIKRIIYRELLQQDIKFNDISNAMPDVRPTVVVPLSKHTYSESSPLYGCDTNDDGYVINPITL